MRSRLTTLPIAMLCIGFAACGTNPANGDDSRGDAGPTTDAATDATTDPIDARPQIWCQPTASSYDIANIPALPERFEAATFCAVDVIALPDDVTANIVWAYDSAMRVLEVTGDESSGSFGTQSFTLDDDGDAIEIHATGIEGFYASGYGETWYTLNADGEMVHKLALSMPFEGADEDTWVVIEKDQTWVDGVLTRFTERDGEGGPLIRETTWQYDADGRLTLATTTDQSNPDVTRVDEAAWTYHNDGQPASVERTMGGIVISRETWTFDGTELVSRTYYGLSNDELVAQLVALPGDQSTGWQTAPLLDSYERPRDQNFSGDLWVASLPVAQQRSDCHILPRGAGHGYPQAEAEHLLGVTANERPAGIGIVYGNEQFGWQHGDFGWYGHHGNGSGWVGVGASIDTVDTEVFYEGGVMVRETGDANETGETFDYVRQRAVESGRIVSDHVTIESDEDTIERTLVFTRDDDGNIVNRSLLDGEMAVIESQSTEYDEAGHVIAHAIEPSTLDSATQPDPSRGAFLGFGTYTVAAARWTWAYDGANVVERAEHGRPLLGYTGDTRDPVSQTLQYDARGNTVASEGSFLATGSSGGFRTWAYNGADQQTEACFSSDGVSYSCSSTRYDEAGRIAIYDSYDGLGQYYVVAAYDYICSE